MPGFLYYVPTQKGALTQDDLRTAGLLYAFELRKGENPTGRGCSPGPDNMIGLILGQQGEGLGYYPQRQTWRKIPGLSSGAWVGFETATPPGPDDLLRKEPLDGHRVRLGDGNEWLCPRALAWSGNEGRPRFKSILPSVLDLDDKGQWVKRGVRGEHRALFDVAEWFYNTAAENGGKFSVPVLEAVDKAVLCLATNYRVGAIETAALGLFDSNGGHALEVMFALIDFPAYENALKKKEEADISNGSAGHAA